MSDDGRFACAGDDYQNVPFVELKEPVAYLQMAVGGHFQFLETVLQQINLSILILVCPL
jgi:hypothetical protein